MLKGPKNGHIGVYVAPLGPPERPRVPYPGTALELASWLPQKIVVRKVEIQNYGGKRCCFGLFERSISESALFEARRGPRRPCHRSLDLLFISMDDCANVTASKHPSGDSK